MANNPGMLHSAGPLRFPKEILVVGTLTKQDKVNDVLLAEAFVLGPSAELCYTGLEEVTDCFPQIEGPGSKVLH